MTAFFPQQVQGFPSISWQLICGWFPADVQTLEYHVVPMLSKWAHTSLMLFLFLEPDSSMSTDSPKTSPTWHLPVVFCGIYRATHWNLAQVVSEKYFNFGNLWEDSTWSTMVLRVESSRLIQDLEETLNPPSKVGVLVVWTVDICFFLMDERYEGGLRDKGIANTKDVSSIRSDVDRGGRCDEWSHVSQDQLHFTWPKRGLTCFYLICQFPYTRKTNLRGFEYSIHPFPRPPRNKQNDKHTHSQKQKVILDTVIKKQLLRFLNISTLHERGLCFLLQNWNSPRCGLHRQALNLKLPDGILGILKPTMYQSEVPMFFDRWVVTHHFYGEKRLPFFLRVQRPKNMGTGEKWEFLGRNVLFWVEDDRGFVLLSTVLTWWWGRQMLWLHILFVVV